MRCEKCKLCQMSLTQILPRGTTTPDIYFVIDNPDEEDCRFAQSLSGSRGRFLDVFLKSMDANNNRYFSLVRCTPYDTEYPETISPGLVPNKGAGIRQPFTDEVQACMPYLLMDIFKTKPKVIVTLGGLPTQALLGNPDIRISRVRGDKLETEIHGEKFIVVPTYSPSYLIKNLNNKEVAEEFFKDLKKAYEIANGTYVDMLESVSLNYAMNYDQFKQYIDTELANEPSLAYDIETNAELIYHKDFDIIGFSLAKRKSGVYVCLDALDYHMSDEDRKKCSELLIDTLRDRNIIVHNANYERPSTIFKYNYELPFDTTDDTLVMAKLMLGGKIGAGLKENAQKLGYPAWDKDLDAYISNFKTAMTRLKLVKFRPLLELMRQGYGIDVIHQLYTSVPAYMTDEKEVAEHETKLETFSEIIEYFGEILQVTRKYYDNPQEFSNLQVLVTKAILNGFDNGIPGTIPYNWIPYKMLCKYGAIDSVATFDLKDHFTERFKNESTEDVNLFKGYKYLLAEHYAGFAMMMSSLKWDDIAAQRDYDFFYQTCVESLKYIFAHPLIKEYIVNKCMMTYLPDIVYEDYNDYFESTFDKRVVVWDTDEDGKNIYKLQTINPDTGRPKRVHIKHLMTGVELPPSIMNDIKSRISDLLMKDIEKCNDLDELKSYFNPASTTAEVSSLATQVLLTDEFRFARLVKELQLLLDKEDFNIDALQVSDQAVMKAIQSYVAITAKSNPDDWVDLRRVAYAELEDLVTRTGRFYDKDMQTAVGVARNMVLEGLGDETQIMIYETLKMTPLDPDNPTTWTDIFKWLVKVRWYKKSVKIMGSYIEGKVGRASVYVAQRTPLEEGKDVVYRLRHYDECEQDENGLAKIADDEVFLEQTQFGVGTAETGRWKSAFHVLPTGSSVKKLYRSRFKGGTILQPDYSANEVRCIASASGEQSMLDAFARGADIHRSNAAMIYKLPEEEVTSFQRRFAKTATFSILYGASAYSVAMNYFNGNLQQGEQLLTDFYTAFPNIKKWIDARHEEVLTTHKVSVLTQRFLNIDFNPNDKAEVESAKRASANYPIQSASSSLAAIVFSDIIRYMRSNNMKSKPILFIHDSVETDVYPYELLQVLEYQKVKLANGAIEYFNIQCRADISMGVSLGHECELEELEVLDKEQTKAYITLSGWKDEIEDTYNNWKVAYHRVEVIEESWKDVYTPLDQTFIPRKAFDPTVMSTRGKGHCKLYIQYYDDNGKVSPMCDEVPESSKPRFEYDVYHSAN